LKKTYFTISVSNWLDTGNDLALLKAEGNFSQLPIAVGRAARLDGTGAAVGFPNIGLNGFAPKFARGEMVLIPKMIL
jgi:hypothetical protein